MKEVEPREADSRARYQVKREELDRLKVQTEEKTKEVQEAKEQIYKLNTIIGGEKNSVPRTTTFGNGDETHGRFPSANDPNFVFGGSDDEYDDEDGVDYVGGDLHTLTSGRMRTSSKL